MDRDRRSDRGGRAAEFGTLGPAGLCSSSATVTRSGRVDDEHPYPGGFADGNVPANILESYYAGI